MNEPRPTISANLAISADGKIAAAHGPGGRFTSGQDRKMMDMLRHDTDAILIGGRTLREANPCLQVKHAAAVAARLATGRTSQPRAIVLSASGLLPLHSRCLGGSARVQSAHPQLLAPPTPWAAVPKSAAGAAQKHLGEYAQALPIELTALALRAFVRSLSDQGINHLLVEGGGETLWHFAQAGLLDTLHLTLAPCLIGGQRAPGLLAGEGFSLLNRLHLKLLKSAVSGDEIFLSYSVINTKPPL